MILAPHRQLSPVHRLHALNNPRRIAVRPEIGTMRILPRTRWQWARLILVIGISFKFVSPQWWASQIRYNAAMVSPNRVRDKAGVISFAHEWRFERFLQMIEDESGVDIRFLLVPSVEGETLEQFGVRMARKMGVGQDLDRRGLLFVYDVAQRRLRIEVGMQMEPIITDAFAGYLMREHVRSFFGTGNPSLGLRTTLFMVQHRLREAVLGREYDPTFGQFILDQRRLAVGGGASGDMQLGQDAAFLNRERTSPRAVRAYFSAQPTPEAAYHRYLEWLARGRYETDVPLFTPLSQEYMATLTMTTGFNDHILMMEYGKPYRVDTRGDLALLYFTTDPLLSPHFLRRTRQGWVLDMWAEILNVRNYSGWYTWALLPTGDDFAVTFADRYQSYWGLMRVRGGDNRPLPVKSHPGIKLQPAPDPADTLPTVNIPQLTVDEAATRIGGSGRALVLIYHTWSQYDRARMPALAQLAEECRSKGAEVLAFSTDREPQALEQLPGVLERSKAPFTAVQLRPWQSGHLTRAMAPVGVRIPAHWEGPIVAVRNGAGGVVVQTVGYEELAANAARVRGACSR
jgi:uncharacterized protein